MKNHEGRVAALLLIGDIPDADKRALIAQAFNRSCIPKMLAPALDRTLREALEEIGELPVSTKSKRAKELVKRALGVLAISN